MILGQSIPLCVSLLRPSPQVASLMWTRDFSLLISGFGKRACMKIYSKGTCAEIFMGKFSGYLNRIRAHVVFCARCLMLDLKFKFCIIFPVKNSRKMELWNRIDHQLDLLLHRWKGRTVIMYFCLLMRVQTRKPFFSIRIYSFTELIT